jgi:hypothetical protein
MESGLSLRTISMSTGVNRTTLRDWRDHPEKLLNHASCPRCAESPSLPEPHAEYAYLLGLYLGDGCISRGGARDKNVWKLRIICADAWPGLIQECTRAMSAIRPDNKVSTQQKVGCTEVASYSRHWPCLMPQHAAGRKHLRRIELQTWQRLIVTGNPGHFARGLFHSDGYRGINRIRARLADGVIAGMSIRGTCSPTNRQTFSGCAARHWMSSGWRGGFRGGMPYRWHGRRRWRGLMSSSGQSTDLVSAALARGRESGRR